MSQNAPQNPLEHLQEIELSDGGVIEILDDDGTIRRRDVHGNTEEVRDRDSPDWQEWADLFHVNKSMFPIL